MASLDVNKILNESKPKVLIREFNNLKEDYTRINAVKYKGLYENEDLSFILDYSRFIFSEPMKGFAFYKNIIETQDIPVDRMFSEYEKLDEFLDENEKHMSDEQKNMYEELKIAFEKQMKEVVPIISLVTMDDPSIFYPLYDALYRIKKNPEDVEDKDLIISFFNKKAEEKDFSMGVIFTLINFSSHFPELAELTIRELRQIVTDNPTSVEEALATSKVLHVVHYISYTCKYYDQIHANPNMNFRFLLTGIRDLQISDILNRIMIRKVDPEVNFSTPLGMMNSILRNDDLKSVETEHETDEKILPVKIRRALLVFEKAIIEHAFKDGYTDEANFDFWTDDVIMTLCVKSDDLYQVVRDPEDCIRLLEKEIKTSLEIIDKFYKSHLKEGESYEESTYTERYFSADGTHGKIVGSSIGGVGENPKKKGVDEEPKKAKSSTKIEDEPEEDEDDIEDDVDDDDVEEACKDLADARNFVTEVSKLAKKHNANFFLVTDGASGYSNGNETTNEAVKLARDNQIKWEKEKGFDPDENWAKEATEDEDDIEKNPSTETTVKTPSKKNVFQRIQNKALDADVQFKKKVANGKRLETDAKNALKAVAKIPENIVNSVKKDIEHWDEMDDNRRKEYIIKPGIRKKYFRALRLCLMHYGAFAINPVLNIVLFICQALGKTKDVRIRNELIRELKAEIRVTEEKISDANANGDQKQKYQLMRIKEKLEAEMARVTLNSSVV